MTNLRRRVDRLGKQARVDVDDCRRCHGVRSLHITRYGEPDPDPADLHPVSTCAACGRVLIATWRDPDDRGNPAA